MVLHRSRALRLALGVPLLLASPSCSDDPAAPRLPPEPAAIAITPAEVALSSIGSTTRLAAQVSDENGEPMPAARVLWYTTDPRVAVVDTAGVVTATGVGQTLVGAVAGDAMRHVQVAVTQTATSLAFRAQPVDGTAGAPLPRAIQVEIRDVEGRRVLGASDAITLSLAGAPDDVALEGAATVNAQDGVATFVGVYVARAGDGYALHASASGLAGAASTAFDIEAGPAAAVTIDVSPDTIIAAHSVSFVAQVVDAWRNPVSADVVVRLTMEAAPAGAPPGIEREQATVDGVAMFDFADATTAGEYTMRAQAAGLDAGTARFVVRHSEAHELRLENAPPRLEAGGRYFLRAALRDRYGNLVIDHADPVRVELLGGSELEGDTLVVPDSGIAIIEATIHDVGYHVLHMESGVVEGYESVIVGFTARALYGGPSDRCVITRLDLTYCWGTNPAVNGGAHGGRPAPLGVAAEDIALGAEHACARTSAEVYCWGNGALLGETPDGSTLRSASRLAAGGRHTCALDGATLYCWGDSGWGQVGNGAYGVIVPQAEVIAPQRRWAWVTLGREHSCAIDADTNHAWCWGSNASLQLGFPGFPDFSDTPAWIGDTEWRRLSAGGEHTCGITTERVLYCWGANGSGQLGDGTTTSRYTMGRVGAALEFVQVAAGRAHTCAITAYGQTLCWGSNAFGQLGDGSVQDRATPAIVLGDQSFGTLVAGDDNTCGLTTAGDVYCWGAGPGLGTGATVVSLIPVRVSP